MKKLQRISQLFLIMSFMSIISFFCVMTVVSAKINKETRSVFEYRSLAKRPALTVKNILSGGFAQQFSDYCKDHFYLRNEILTAYVAINKDILHSPVINDIYLADGVLLPFNEYSYKTDDMLYEKAVPMVDSISMLNKLVKSYGGEFLYVGMPGQTSIFRDKYPEYLSSERNVMEFGENVFIPMLMDKGIKVLDLVRMLLDEPDPIIYYSAIDHHAKYDGAFYMYQAVMNILREDNLLLTPYGRDDFVFTELPNIFYGSRSRRLYNLMPYEEHLVMAEPINPIAFTKTDLNASTLEYLRTDTIFSMPPDEDSPIDYSFYMAGDNPETVIGTNRPELPNLLLFGDSFTNPVETLIYLNFNETRILDLRYYTKMTLSEYITKYKPDYVVYMRDDLNYLNEKGNGRIE